MIDCKIQLHLKNRVEVTRKQQTNYEIIYIVKNTSPIYPTKIQPQCHILQGEKRYKLKIRKSRRTTINYLIKFTHFLYAFYRSHLCFNVTYIIRTNLKFITYQL